MRPRQAMAMTLLVGSVSLVVILLAVFIEDVTLMLPRVIMPRFF